MVLSSLLISTLALLASHSASAQGNLNLTEVQMHASGTSNISPFMWEMFDTLMARAKPAAFLSYRSVGSGSGQLDVRVNETESNSDFSCGDIPLSSEMYQNASNTDNPVFHVPLLAGTVSIFAKIPGISQAAADQGIKIPPCALVKIFNGNISQWNDTEIAEANPDLELPDSEILVVHRAPGSSSTYALTNYLHEASKNNCTGTGIWPEGEASKSVSNSTWSENKFEAPSSQEVVEKLQSEESAIGYVESNQGKTAGLKEVQIQNSEGTYLKMDAEPEPEVAGPTVLNETLPYNIADNFTDAKLINRPGNNTWPLSLITFCYVRQDLTGKDNKGGLTAFVLEYLLSEEAASRMKAYGLIPLPQDMRERYKEQLRDQLITDLTWTEEGLDVDDAGGQGDRVMSVHRNRHVLLSVNNLLEDMSDVQSNQTTLRDDVSAVRADHTALSSEVTSLSSNQTDLSAEVSNHASEISSLMARMDILESSNSTQSPSPSAIMNSTVTQDQFTALEASTASTDTELRRELEQVKSDQADTQEALDVAIAGLVLGLILGLAGLIVAIYAVVKAKGSSKGAYGISATDNLAVDNPYFSRP